MRSFGLADLILKISLVVFLASCPGGEGPTKDLSPSVEDGGGVDLNMEDARLSASCEKEKCEDPAKPICDPDPPCRACGNDDECRLRAGRLKTNDPYCGGGTCVQCTNGSLDTQCAKVPATAGMTCNSNQCEKCKTDGQCSLGVCDAGNEFGRPERCLDDSIVISVNNASACPGSGTAQAPYCTLSQAMGAITATRRVIRLAGSNTAYGLLSIDGSKDVTIYGPGYGSVPSARLNGVKGMTNAISISGSAKLRLRGIEVNGGVNGVVCTSGGTVLIRNSQIHKMDKQGLDLTDCTLTLEQSRISENQEGGILMSRVKYTMVNNFIVDNVPKISAVQMLLGCSGDFQYNTVANNVAPIGQAGGVDCGSSVKTLEDSIIFGNRQNLSGSQIAQCSLLRTAVGATDTAPNGIRMDPSFVDSANPNKTLRNYRLNPINLCCINVPLANSSVLVDHFGNARPKNGGFDIGAHEAN